VVLSENPNRTFGLEIATEASRSSRIRTESTPPIDIMIAWMPGSAKAALRSSARRRGFALRSAGVIRAVGSSRIVRPNTRRSVSRPRSKTGGKTFGPPHDVDATATVSPAWRRIGLMYSTAATLLGRMH